MAGKPVVLKAVSKIRKLLDHFREALQAAGLVAHESKCPVLTQELEESEKAHLFGSERRSF